KGVTEVAVRADGVVIADQSAAVELIQGHHRIELRAEAAGVAVNIVRLALLRLEAEEIDIARLVDDAVQCQGQLGLRCGGARVVRLNRDDVAVLRHAERDRRRRDAAFVLRVDAELRTGLLRQLDLLLDLPGRIAKEANLDLLARLAAGRNNSQRTREGADVQAVHAGAVAAIGTIAHLDD